MDLILIIAILILYGKGGGKINQEMLTHESPHRDVTWQRARQLRRN